MAANRWYMLGENTRYIFGESAWYNLGENYWYIIGRKLTGQGIYKTTDGGDSWETINEGLTSLDVEVIIIDPHRPDTLYVGVNSVGVFKSTDGGDYWTHASNGLPLPSMHYRLAIDSREPNTLYASMARFEEDQWIGLGIYKSTDRGMSWNPFSNGLPVRILIDTIVEDPTSARTLYVGTCCPGAVYRTNNSGYKWMLSSEGLPPGEWISVVAVNPHSPHIVYAGTASGELFVSDDSGLSWTGLYSGLPQNLHINTIATEAGASKAIYLGTTQGIFRGWDAGLNWISANRGITNADISSIAIHPFNPSKVYAGTSKGQIFDTEDNAQHWSLSWSQSTETRINSLLVSRSNPDAVYAALESGVLLCSGDGGNSWRDIELGDGRVPLRDVVVDMHAQGALYVASWGAGVLKSTDGGQTWFSVSNGLASPFVSAIVSNPHTSGMLYALVDRWGAFKTVDGGATWSRIGSGIPTADPMTTLTIDPVLTKTLYIGTISGVYLSDDGGNTWLPATGDWPTGAQVKTVAVDFSAPGNIYVGTAKHGLFRGNVAGEAKSLSLELYKVIREAMQWWSVVPSIMRVILIATLVILIILLLARVFRFTLSLWIDALFWPNRLFDRIRDSRLTLRDSLRAYVLCVLSGLTLMYLALYGPLSNATRAAVVSQLQRTPHLAVQMDARLIINACNRIGLGIQAPQELTEASVLVTYVSVSIFLLPSLMLLAFLLASGVNLVQKNVHTGLTRKLFRDLFRPIEPVDLEREGGGAETKKTLAALLPIFALANVISLLVSAGLAYFGLRPDPALGLVVSMLSLLWVLCLGLVAIKRIHGLSTVQTVVACITAPFSPLYPPLVGIARLPWKDASGLLLKMLVRPKLAIRELRNVSFSTFGDARPYLLAYALSLGPFWLLGLCLRSLGVSIPEPIRRLFGLFGLWSIWIILPVVVSMVEIGAQLMNRRVCPIRRRKPSEVCQWGTLFRTFFVINAAVDVVLKTTLLVVLVGSSATPQSTQDIVDKLSGLLSYVGLGWKISLCVMAVPRIYDNVHWKQIGSCLSQGLEPFLSVSYHEIGQMVESILRRPEHIAELGGREKGLEKSLIVFAGGVLCSVLSETAADFFSALYEHKMLAALQDLPARLQNWLLVQVGLLVFWLAFAAFVKAFLESYNLAQQQSDEQGLQPLFDARFAGLFQSYTNLLTCLLTVVGTTNIAVSLAKILLSLLNLAAYHGTVSFLGLICQALWLGLTIDRLINRSLVWAKVSPALEKHVLAWLFAIIAVILAGLSAFAAVGLVVWVVFAIPPTWSIPPTPLLVVIAREDLRTIKRQADAYLLDTLRPDRGRDLYLGVLRMSRVLCDPTLRVRVILEQLGSQLGVQELADHLVPSRLLPIQQDVTSTLVSLSAIDLQDSWDYISASITADDSLADWERVEECQEAALEALAEIVARDEDLVFENIALLLDTDVPPATFGQLAQLFSSELLSQIYLTYGHILMYGEREEGGGEDEESDIPAVMRLVLDLPSVIDDATSIFARARSLKHGEEVFLIYDLLYRSIMARFVRDIVAINLDYSQLVGIDNPVFPEKIAVFSDLWQVTELLMRSEKADLPDKLPYYAQMVEILDRVNEAMSSSRILPIERAAIAIHIVPRWKNLLLARIRELKGRSSIHIAVAKERMIEHRGDVVLTISNDGSGTAEDITVWSDIQDSTIELTPKMQTIHSMAPHTETRVAFRLVQPEVLGKQRVVFNVSYDDLERTGKTETFADAIVFGSRTREFRRLESIPYVAGPPLRTPEMFFGRKEVFEYVLENLRARSQDNIILLHGERRVGKTSLLYQLRQKLERQYIPVYVDLQGMLDPGLAAFLHDLALRIYDALEERGIELPAPELDAFTGMPGSYFRDVFLSKVMYRIGERRLLLMIDEFEVIEDRVNSRKLDKDIFGYLRHLMQHWSIGFIFAGTYNIAKIAKAYWSVLFNIALSKEIKPLSRSETDRLVQDPVADYFEFDRYALDKIWQVTAGHPFFVQLLCRELVLHGNRNEISYFTTQHVGDTIGKLLEAGEIHLGYIWDGLSTEKRILLVVLSNLLQARGIAVLSEIQEILARYDLSLDLDGSLRELLGRGIIREDEGRYSFKIGLIGEWINATRSLESLIQ